MNVSKHKKNTLFKNSQLSHFKEKRDSFMLVESLEQIMIGAFLITTCSQLPKTGSIGKVFIPLGNLTKFHVRK